MAMLSLNEIKIQSKVNQILDQHNCEMACMQSFKFQIKFYLLAPVSLAYF